MTVKKSIRVLLVIAASLILLFIAVLSPRKAEAMERAYDILVSQEDSFCAGDLILELSNEGGYPVYYTLDGSIPTLDSMFYEGAIVMEASDQDRKSVV